VDPLGRQRFGGGAPDAGNECRWRIPTAQRDGARAKFGRATASGKTPLLAAAPKYFLNLEARGLDAKTIRTYRTGVDPFVENCARTYVEDVTKQDMINFMGWLRASFTRRLLLTQKEPAKSGFARDLTTLQAKADAEAAHVHR